MKVGLYCFLIKSPLQGNTSWNVLFWSKFSEKAKWVELFFNNLVWTGSSQMRFFKEFFWKDKISLKNISSTEKKDFLMQTYKESLKAQNGSNQIVLITIDLKYYRIQRRSHHLRFRLKLINFFWKNIMGQNVLPLIQIY